MLQSSYFLITGLSIPNSRVGSEVTTADTTRDLDKTSVREQKSYLTITLAGITRTYTDMGHCLFSKKDTTECWYNKVGTGQSNFLSIAVCGSYTGIFTIGNSQPTQQNISVVTYGIGQSVYSSYYTRADQLNDYLLTEGVVHVERYKKHKLTKGLFQGTLMPLHSIPCSTNLLAISGQFCLTR